jgi:hypothetical protein
VGKRVLHSLSVYPKRTLKSLTNIPWFFRTKRQFTSLLKKERILDSWPVDLLPMLNDVNAKGGTASGHYFHQDLLVAQRIYERNPSYHVDFGSRVDGFVAHVASFRALTFIDLRPLAVSIPNIDFRIGDLTCMDWTAFIPRESVSCLHVIV